ncbi:MULTISPECIES: copper-containing nitrite reductase [unclassified Luteimonas]|uniref:copper-containing nitrite reductase n=1 Tax=unclassified Luteimonas TaxID=2629088 RepID=UPI0016004A32|nr:MULTISPECIES: copper-containing nitrite reductase [unclassified Luteimonas]MBB1471728.1 nitrite reductase, copper-containing [Luteimonas sp. MC1782]MBB6599529.1 nitrite reductase, copper-containing [Luteimonas sp. MC1825]QOC87226.1 nitrite reductase, copper-containing [Luteimonas sp. MC1825]
MNVLKTTLLSAALALACGAFAAPPAYAVDALELMQSTIDQAPDLSALAEHKVQLVRPPFVHAHDQVAPGAPRLVKFTLPIEEKEIVIDDKGTRMHAMTFGGSIPGPMMVVHEGDYVELKLINLASNSMPHNIDFHAATGALGGGDFTVVSPGEEVTLRWKATRSGTFIYHCAPGGSMTPWHVVQGMHGTIMVLPRDGLKDGDGKPLRYDRAYYVGETDFYIPRDADGNFRSYGSSAESLPDTLATMRTLTPSHIVFNGAVGALTGENAMTAKVGETVLFVHSQANRDTRPHLIGGHGDYVWEEGKFDNAPMKDLETWFIRGGSAGAALYTFLQPGLHVYLNHNLIEAVELGAAGHVQVSGDRWNHDLMTQPAKTGPIRPDTDLSMPVAR